MVRNMEHKLNTTTDKTVFMEAMCIPLQSMCFHLWFYFVLWASTCVEYIYFIVTHVSLSLWHLARALHKLGSGHRSNGVCPFLFLMPRSAPLPAKKQAMEAEDFLSAPWLPSPINSCNNIPTV